MLMLLSNYDKLIIPQCALKKLLPSFFSLTPFLFTHLNHWCAHKYVSYVEFLM